MTKPALYAALQQVARGKSRAAQSGTTTLTIEGLLYRNGTHPNPGMPDGRIHGLGGA